MRSEGAQVTAKTPLEGDGLRGQPQVGRRGGAVTVVTSAVNHFPKRLGGFVALGLRLLPTEIVLPSPSLGAAPGSDPGPVRRPQQPLAAVPRPRRGLWG